MKLILTHQAGLAEAEVEIRYAEMNARLQSIVRRVETAESYLYGGDNGRQYRIAPDDILYIESVDRKTFIYTAKAVFRSELKLYQILERLADADFVQVSKACILNINALENVRMLLNSRMEGTLSNGERITISRTYLPAIRAAFSMEGGNAR